MQQATVNLLADMGVQPGHAPARPEPRERLDGHRGSVGVRHVAGQRELDGGGGSSRSRLTGTAADAGGGRVGAVEVSVDGGASWHPADGRETWSYTWTPVRSPAG